MGGKKKKPEGKRVVFLVLFCFIYCGLAMEHVGLAPHPCFGTTVLTSGLPRKSHRESLSRDMLNTCIPVVVSSFKFW